MKEIRITPELFDSLRKYCDNNRIRFQDFVENALENAADAEEQIRIWEENRKLAAHIAEVREQARMNGFLEGFYTGFLTMQGNLRISLDSENLKKEYKESYKPVEGPQLTLF